MKNKRVLIKGSDIHGDFTYRGIEGTLLSGPILSNGAICYFIKPDNDLPESLFLSGTISEIFPKKKQEISELVKIKELEDLAGYNKAQLSMVGRIYQTEDLSNGIYTILGQKFPYSNVESVGLGNDFIRKLFDINSNVGLESGLIEVHNDLVKYKAAYERLANDRLSDNT
jgi:hypothetical protein